MVLPYNYPGLWSLLDELASPALKMIPSPRWRQEFERYLGTVPPYYLPYLRTGTDSPSLLGPTVCARLFCASVSHLLTLILTMLCRRVPSYVSVFVHLRAALKRWGAPPNLIPEHVDGGLSYALSSYLKKLKQQSKMDTDRAATTASAKNSAAPNRDALAAAAFSMPQVNKPLPRTASGRSAYGGVDAADAMDTTPAPVVETDASAYILPNVHIPHASV